MKLSIKEYIFGEKSYFYISADYLFIILTKEFKFIGTDFRRHLDVSNRYDEKTDFKTREEAENHLRKYIRLKKLEKIKGVVE